jgi:hypothetical protein
MPTLVTLPDFIVNIDAADHVVVDHVSEIGTLIQTIDFGSTGEVAAAVDAWFAQSPSDRDVWAPVMNTYLLHQFEKRS